MSATVGQVKQALATSLATISGLRTFARQPDQINAPMAFPTLQTIDYHQAMGNGLVTHTYAVTIIVGRASERASETLLDTFLSYDQGGVRYAIESDPSLGGVARTSIVESATQISSIEGNDTVYLTVDFRVIVYA